MGTYRSVERTSVFLIVRNSSPYTPFYECFFCGSNSLSPFLNTL